MNKEAIEVIRQAKNLLEKGWTKDKFACDNRGKEVSLLHEKACKFCAIGAVNRAMHWSDPNFKLDTKLHAFVFKHLANNVNICYPNIASLPELNDKLGKNAVIWVFDTTIKNLKNASN